MYIRESTNDKDIPILVDLVVEAFGSSPNIARNTILKSNTILIIYDETDKIIGFVCYRYLTDKIIFVDYFVIDKNHHNKGIASLVLDYSVKDLRSKGVEKIIAFISGVNPKAFNIFSKWGFNAIKFLPNGVIIGVNI
ncbi:GNAT family N-acetyltransferase [Priestia aryabhattai]|uniref:GNAT family N-acetyltransferase n=1 Tax=Priestia aryabhattai TaxID=412384 RepID=UPI001C8D4CF0|nr:GNAT family N-acetyltransferase [Priestia aryabhattai]MBX9988381.1 GNAT family N-acetyltransferase [Priestia aryabhattai]